MNDFEKLQSQLKLYAKIQERLYSLNPASSDEEIENFFKIIPSTFYEQKENIIMICQFFARFEQHESRMGRVTIKLFERILHQIKQNFQFESSLIWEIFGSCSYFKLWMYKEGLIDIEQILQSSLKDETSLTAQYFLPEIIEHNPDYFYNEIIDKFQCFSSENSYSKQAINDLKNLRDKHFVWLKESNDYHDELYKEIEKNPIRLAIKKDDVESFQFLLSRSNLSINSVIDESIVECSLNKNVEMHLIEFAAKFNALNIFNFLLLNDAEINPSIVNFVIHFDNYNMIHAVEPKLYAAFLFNGMLFAIESWNSDVINYIMEKYHYTFLIENQNKDESDDKEEESDDYNNDKKEIDDDKKEINDDEKENDDDKKEIDDDEKEIDDDKKEIDDDEKEIDDDKKEIDDIKKENDGDNSTDEVNKDKNIKMKKHKKKYAKFYDINAVLRIIDGTICSCNMMFFNSILLPFLQNEDTLFINFLNNIAFSAIQDISSFCIDLILHFPEIQKCRSLNETIKKLLIRSIDINNYKALEKLINNANATDINANELVIYACAKLANIQIIKILTHHKNFDIKYRLPKHNVTVVHISLASGNFFALKYFIETFPNFDETDFANEIYYCCTQNHLVCLEYLIKYLMHKYGKEKFQQITEEYKKYYKKQNIADTVILEILKLFDEILKKE